MTAGRGWSAVLAGLVLTGLLTGCSDDPEAGYCDALRSSRSDLVRGLQGGAGSGAGSGAETALGVMKKLKAAAPSELQDEWDTVVFAYEDLVSAVEATGAPIDDFGAKTRPEGVTPQQWRQVRGFAAKLSSARVIDAARGIEDHARQVCDVDLAS
jgi:hypothetical protein